LQSPEDEQTLLVLFAVVHLFAMSSACANPVLYGFLNENFKQVPLGLTLYIDRLNFKLNELCLRQSCPQRLPQ
jgi:hypothetical protein